MGSDAIAADGAYPVASGLALSMGQLMDMPQASNRAKEPGLSPAAPRYLAQSALVPATGTVARPRRFCPAKPATPNARQAEGIGRGRERPGQITRSSEDMPPCARRV